MNVIEGNSENFENDVINSKTPVLVDFNAKWCGPCRMMGPIIEELSEEVNNCKFVSIDVDDEEDLAIKYNISSIPCLIFFKDGKEVKRHIGFVNKEELLKMIGEL